MLSSVHFWSTGEKCRAFPCALPDLQRLTEAGKKVRRQQGEGGMDVSDGVCLVLSKIAQVEETSCRAWERRVMQELGG